MSGPFGFFRVKKPEITPEVKDVGDFEGRLSVLENDFDGLNSDFSLLEDLQAGMDEKIHSQTSVLDDLIGKLPDIVSQETEGWLDTNFKDYASDWFGQVDIKPKVDAWWGDISIRDKITEELDLPEGLVPEDVGEFLGILNHIGKDVPKEMAPIITFPSGFSAGGNKPHHTIANIEDVEGRLRVLMLDDFGTLNSIASGWGGDDGYRAQLTFIRQNWDSLEDVIGDFPTTKANLNSLRGGEIPSPLHSTITGLINSKFGSLQALAGEIDLTTDQKTALSNLMSDAPGTSKPIYSYLDEMSGFWVSDFEGLGVSDMNERINLWADSNLSDRIGMEVPGFITSDAIRDKMTLDGIKLAFTSEEEEGNLWFKTKMFDGFDGMGKDDLTAIMNRGILGLSEAPTRAKCVRDKLELIRTTFGTASGSLSWRFSELGADFDDIGLDFKETIDGIRNTIDGFPKEGLGPVSPQLSVVTGIKRIRDKISGPFYRIQERFEVAKGRLNDIRALLQDLASNLECR